jgi:hypothetical protein
VDVWACACVCLHCMHEQLSVQTNNMCTNIRIIPACSIFV